MSFVHTLKTPGKHEDELRRFFNDKVSYDAPPFLRTRFTVLHSSIEAVRIFWLTIYVARLSSPGSTSSLVLTESKRRHCNGDAIISPIISSKQPRGSAREDPYMASKHPLIN